MTFWISDFIESPLKARTFPENMEALWFYLHKTLITVGQLVFILLLFPKVQESTFVKPENRHWKEELPTLFSACSIYNNKLILFTICSPIIKGFLCLLAAYYEREEYFSELFWEHTYHCSTNQPTQVFASNTSFHRTYII